MKRYALILSSVILLACLASGCTHALRQSEEERLAAGGAPRASIPQDSGPRTLHAGGPPVLLTDTEYAIWQKEHEAQQMEIMEAAIIRRHEEQSKNPGYTPTPPANAQEAAIQEQERMDGIRREQQMARERMARERNASTTTSANTAAHEFLSAFARHWPRTYRVHCTTTTSRSRSTYRTDTSCY